MNATEFKIHSPPNTAIVSTHELARLIENTRRFDYLLKHCTYLEDGATHTHYWSRLDDARMDGDECLSLVDYLDLRIAGKPIPITPPKDEAQEPEDRRDHDRDARREEMEPMHYAGLLFPHQEP